MIVSVVVALSDQLAHASVVGKRSRILVAQRIRAIAKFEAQRIAHARLLAAVAVVRRSGGQQLERERLR